MKFALLVCILVAFVAASAFAADPARPKFPPVFEATFNGLVAARGRGQSRTSGIWVNDLNTGDSVVNWTSEDSARHPHFHHVERYSLGRTFTVQNRTGTCFINTVFGKMHDPWDFLSYAAFAGTRNFHGTNCNVWASADASGTVHQVCAVEPANNAPLIYERNHGQEDFEVFFFSEFKPYSPAQSWFEIPEPCQIPSPKANLRANN